MKNPAIDYQWWCYAMDRARALLWDQFTNFHMRNAGNKVHRTALWCHRCLAVDSACGLSYRVQDERIVALINFSFGANVTTSHLIAHRLALSRGDSCLNQSRCLSAAYARVWQYVVFFSLKLTLMNFLRGAHGQNEVKCQSCEISFAIER
jgi:hypothetical protein